MSFVITLYVREGIVLASDSRLTLDTTERQDDGQTLHLAVGQSDSTSKTFLYDPLPSQPGAAPRVGISTYGDAYVQGVPVAGYIESFVSEKLAPKGREVELDNVPQQLIDYFRAMPGPPDVNFFVTGYKFANGIAEQYVWLLSAAHNEIERVNRPDPKGGPVCGAWWGGEVDVMKRLTYQLYEHKQDGTLVSLPRNQVYWSFFTLQDAIDYSLYAVRTTIETLRFQLRAKTVGGPIDVLVIKPTEAFWVQRKALHA